MKEEDKKGRLRFKKTLPNKDNKKKINNLKMKKFKKFLPIHNSNKDWALDG